MWPFASCCMLMLKLSASHIESKTLSLQLSKSPLGHTQTLSCLVRHCNMQGRWWRVCIWCAGRIQKGLNLKSSSPSVASLLLWLFMFHLETNKNKVTKENKTKQKVSSSPVNNRGTFLIRPSPAVCVCVVVFACLGALHSWEFWLRRSGKDEGCSTDAHHVKHSSH